MSVTQLLLNVKARGLTIDPNLATGDDALGFWKALAQVFPKTKEQHCRVHKTANVLDKLPKRIQSGAKDMLHEIWMADTREHAHQAFDLFLDTYGAKYPWRLLNGSSLLPDVVQGIKFIDGVKETKNAA